MRLRREDDRLELTATMGYDESGNLTATVTSIPKAGISAEDLLGAVIKLTEAGSGTVIYVTLTSSGDDSSTNVRVLRAFGVVNHAENGSIMLVTLEHREDLRPDHDKNPFDTVTITGNRSAS